MKIAVVGAGNMGSGIAQKYATEGHEVVLYDNSETGLKLGKEKIESTLREALERKLFNADRVESIKSHLSFSDNLSDLSDCDLIIEAIFEDKQIKQDLFRELDVICAPSTIFATNTSSFRVEDLSSVTGRPDKFVGLHYFYHPAKNRLVEIINGTQTSEDTFRKVFELQEAIGKIPITSADSPGFVVNRFFVPWLNEAMRIVDEGIANIPTVEWAAKKVFGIGMGPFELMNVTGVPITLHACTTLFDELGEFYRPCPLIEPVVQSKSKWDLSGPINEQAFQSVSERLEGVVFAVAKEMVLKERVCSIEECDLGARVGLRWRSGPFEMMALRTDPSLAPKKVQSTKQGSFGIITLNRPDALNALDKQVFKELEAAFDSFEGDSSIDGIVLSGKGKSFAAGADTQFFIDNMRAKDIQRIVDFASYGQDVLKKIAKARKPVVAVAHGMTLGGGLELALACDYIVCVDGAQLGFPETGIGIYPGLGGTQRTARRLGVALARWLILSGEFLNAQRALELGLVDTVCAPNQAFEAAFRWIKAHSNQETSAKKPEGTGHFEELESYFCKPLNDLIREKPTTTSADVEKALKRIAFKAPIALQMADELILASQTLPLEEGLSRETQGLAKIFSTQDALVGISSIGKERPVFLGQ